MQVPEHRDDYETGMRAMSAAGRIIIDGYNVIRTNPSGERIERTGGGAAARQWLVALCRRAMAPGEQWFVVFDGDGTGQALDSGGAQLTVRFAAPASADALIRDMARDSLAAGPGCLIASSDGEVRVDGCAVQDSAAFYDFLLRRGAKKNRAPDSGAADTAEKLLAYLAKCGHIQAGAFIPAGLREGLRELLRYVAAERVRPQKIARDAERLLREGLRLSPDPDTEKAVFRTIKHFFEKHPE